MSSVNRAIQIIEFIADAPRRLNEITSHFDVHRTTIFRQLQILEEAGFLLRRADGTYSIGARIISIAQQGLDNLDLRQIAHEEIRSLQQRAGNTVHLAQLLEDTVVYIDKAEGTNTIQMYSGIGRPVLPNCTGVGKAILAQLSPQRRDIVLRDVTWEAYTPTTHTSRATLDVELEEIRTRGWGVDNGEFEEFVNCIAAPITNSTGSVVAGLSITSIKMINDLDDLRTHLDDLLATSRRISLQLG